MAKTKKTTKKVAKKVVAKKGLVIVHSPVNPTQEFIVASELADDQAIENELLGKAMEHYVYSFSQKGKMVTGLTVAGVNEMSRQLTRKNNSGIKIRVIPESVKIEHNAEMEDKKGVSVFLIAENMLTGETAIGAKFEPYKKTGRNGLYENTFSLEKAVSKAERNAKRKLIPEKVAVEMIKKFVAVGKVQEIQAPVQRAITPKIESQSEVNYLNKFIKVLAEASRIKIVGNLTREQTTFMVDTFNSYTGMNIKSLRVSQSTAKKYLFNFINSPLMTA